MIPASRREFLRACAATGAAWVISRAAQAAAPVGPWVCAFSKHLQFISGYKDLARAARELGLDGLDLTVRAKGHVEPTNVAVDLPRAVDAIRSEGLEVAMITTNLNSADDPDARPILKTASSLGIRYVRVGGLRYSENGDITAELKTFTRQLRGLAELLESFHMAAGFHNHSGGTYVGAPLWDLYEAIVAINSRHFGSNFDVGHATVEGGLAGWRLNARLLAPHVKMTAVKDFVWENGKVRWVPLGQGVVQTAEFFKIFRAAGFAGPVSMHFEYEVENNDAMLENIRAAALVMRTALKDSGYA